MMDMAAFRHSTYGNFRMCFPDFSPETMPAIPAGWIDQSWRNEACPSFNTRTGYVVFIDYADRDAREIPEAERFSIDADIDTHGHNDTLFACDDWAEVLAFVGAAFVGAA